VDIFLITFTVFIFMALALALGLLFGREGIQGSCGGLNRIPGLEGSCGACTNKRCPRKKMSKARTTMSGTGSAEQ